MRHNAHREKLDHIVESFDQKNAPDYASRRLKFTRFECDRRIDAMGQAVSNEERRTLFALGNLREIIGQFVFLDDEKMIAIGFDQSQVAKSLHEQADPWPRRADHSG